MHNSNLYDELNKEQAEALRASISAALNKICYEDLLIIDQFVRRIKELKSVLRFINESLKNV